jgi:hypothetical protein
MRKKISLKKNIKRKTKVIKMITSTLIRRELREHPEIEAGEMETLQTSMIDTLRHKSHRKIKNDYFFSCQLTLRKLNNTI